MENCLEFSSPLGDGLVQNIESKKDTLENFRPRVGMGWFIWYYFFTNKNS